MCGATFNDMDVPNELQSVCVLMHKCYDPIENNITAVASLKSFVSTVPGLYQRQLILKIIIHSVQNALSHKLICAKRSQVVCTFNAMYTVM